MPPGKNPRHQSHRHEQWWPLGPCTARCRWICWPGQVMMVFHHLLPFWHASMYVLLKTLVAYINMTIDFWRTRGCSYKIGLFALELWPKTWCKSWWGEPQLQGDCLDQKWINTVYYWENAKISSRRTPGEPHSTLVVVDLRWWISKHLLCTTGAVRQCHHQNIW